MKLTVNLKKYRFLLFFVILLISITACRQASSSNNEPQPVTGELKSSQRDRSIAINFSRLMELRHVSKHKIDDEISKRAFGLFFKSLDPRKIYFMKSDVDEFAAKYKTKLDDYVKKGDLTPAFEIYNRFIVRVDERCQMAQEILKMPLDFSKDEYYVWDKDKIEYANDEAEIRDRLRRKIKAEILELEVTDRDEKEEAAEKEKKKKETTKDSQSATPVEEESVTVKEERSPVERLVRRYSSLVKRIHQMTDDDVLESFLTAISNSFDPHSSYMSPKTYENFSIQISLNLEGIGATLGWEDGYTVVKHIVKGGAADKQGELKVNDRIISVGQGKAGAFEDVVDLNLSDVVAKIRGKQGTTVRLEVLSAGKKGNKIITIVREKIALDDSAAQSKIFEVGKKADGTPYKVGVIDLPSFYFDMKALSKGDSSGRSTTRDVRKILQDFVAQNVDACVIDVRFNGGGSLQEVINMTGLFIDTGTVVMVSPSEYGPNRAKSLDDRDPGIDWGGPLVVITSKFSASAAEIFAGAIKDYKRGIIVGDHTTHGKGTVQPVIELAELLFGILSEKVDMGTLKVSIQGFFLPHGESTQLIGVESDIELPSITNNMEGSEADSDYPLKFDKIQPAAQYPVFDYVNNDILDQLKGASRQRIEKSEDFQRVLKNIAIYQEMKEKKRTALNRKQYFAEIDRLDLNKHEKEEYEKLIGMDQKIIRDYYMNEVLDITVNYLDLLKQRNITFQKEKMSPISSSIFSFGL